MAFRHPALPAPHVHPVSRLCGQTTVRTPSEEVPQGAPPDAQSPNRGRGDKWADGSTRYLGAGSAHGSPGSPITHGGRDAPPSATSSTCPPETLPKAHSLGSTGLSLAGAPLTTLSSAATSQAQGSPPALGPRINPRDPVGSEASLSRHHRPPDTNPPWARPSLLDFLAGSPAPQPDSRGCLGAVTGQRAALLAPPPPPRARATAHPAPRAAPHRGRQASDPAH